MNKLRSALALATEEELAELAELLFRAKFNPLDYVQTQTPETIRSLPLRQQREAIEARFRFLAADGLTTILGEAQTLSYRAILQQTCRHLKLDANEDFTTEDLEAEIFLHILQHSYRRMDERERQQFNRTLQQSLQAALRQTDDPNLKRALHANSLRLALEGGSALAISSLLRPWLLRLLARQFALHMARYQLAQAALVQGGALVARLQGQVALQLAKRGLISSTARYATTRTVLGFLGPAMWAWFFADLGWRSISTNHARIIPAIFLLAQIRLTRGDSLYSER